MKKIVTVLFIFPGFQLFAQKIIPLPKVTNTIKTDIEKVTKDYYHHFFNIRGEKIAETESTVEYQSKVIPQGASASTISEIKSLHDVYSWQASMFTTEDFEKAVEKYKQIYNQLEGANFIIHDNKSWKFRGLYDIPDENRAFASSILEPDIDKTDLQRLKIEVALNYTMAEWTVTIFVYEKENDADIRPTGKPAQ
jgi:hypothetical protein